MKHKKLEYLLVIFVICLCLGGYYIINTKQESKKSVYKFISSLSVESIEYNDLRITDFNDYDNSILRKLTKSEEKELVQIINQISLDDLEEDDHGGIGDIEIRFVISNYSYQLSYVKDTDELPYTSDTVYLSYGLTYGADDPKPNCPEPTEVYGKYHWGIKNKDLVEFMQGFFKNE